MTGLRKADPPTKSNFTKALDVKKTLSDVLRKAPNVGLVEGPGTGTSDDVEIQASDGEFVLPADTVDAVGEENLDALIDDTHKPVNKKGLRNFADGGRIDKKKIEGTTPPNIRPDIRPNIRRAQFDPFAPAIEAQEKRKAEERQSTFDKAITGQLGLRGSAKAAGTAVLDSLGLSNLGARQQRSGNPPRDDVESAIPIPEQRPERLSRDVAGTGIREVRQEGETPLFTNLSDAQLADQPTQVSTLPASAAGAFGGTSQADVNEARRAALERGDTASVRRSLRLAQGGAAAESQRLDDRAAQIQLRESDTPSQRRQKLIGLREIENRRQDLAAIEQTGINAQTQRETAGLRAATDIETANINAQSRILAAERAAGRGGKGAEPSLDEAINSFQQSELNRLPLVDGEPDVAGANRSVRGAQTAIANRVQELRSQGRNGEADRLNERGIAALTVQDRNDIAVGQRLRKKFIDFSPSFFSQLFFDPKVGDVSDDPLDFLPVNFNESEGRIVFAGGQEIDANQIPIELLRDIQGKLPNRS